MSNIAHGLESPLFDLTPYLEENYSESGEKNRKHAQQDVKLNIVSTDKMAVVKVMLMKESNLSKEERARLYCRRLGYCNTNIFKIMGSKSEFGNFPKLMVLNEDNIGADLTKLKRAPYKRNDPETKMDSPPWWRVQCDGYGGQGSMEHYRKKELQDHTYSHVCPLIQRIYVYTQAISSFQ